MNNDLHIGAIERTARSQAATRALLTAGLVAVGVGVLTAGAWLSAPFYPVPLTMQTLAVLLVGGLLGPRLGVSTVAAYLAAGAMGAPVFHNGLGGVAVLAGPTGGYLVGFLPAAFLVGLAAQSISARHSDRGGHAQRTTISGRTGSMREIAVLAVGALLAGLAVYAVGLPWLSLFTGSSLSQAAAVGAVPFLLGDLFKTAVAVGAVRLGAPVLSRRGWLPF
jgi:biotin transport system substrate-specific component